ncbi:helix-turn-helix domain-containing protein [Rhizobium sp. GCM10022189]|uniref:helix-turn-helix domain-containing protein n=1 Tax=Rhizobium sp. GCM10022189 TaxID=3252654 RepID=UPI00360D4462
MAAIRKDAFAERLPDEVEIRNAEQLRAIIASQLKSDEGARLSLAQPTGEIETITLSPALAASFMEVLRLVSTGRGFRMIPVDAELTTQEAADCLNVSRPYLIKLLESGAIPHVKTGRHRKVRASELFAYKQRRDETRSAALSELAVLDADLL